jgi:hypothetical protein
MADTDTWLALERRYWEAIKAGDTATALALTDDPTIIVAAQGAADLSREALRPMFDTARWQLRSYEVRDFVAREVVPGTVITAYKLIEQLTVDGKPLTLEANDSSVWVQRDGEWLCALHTESPAGDPFGRDRAKG